MLCANTLFCLQTLGLPDGTNPSYSNRQKTTTTKKSYTDSEMNNLGFYWNSLKALWSKQKPHSEINESSELQWTGQLVNLGRTSCQGYAGLFFIKTHKKLSINNIFLSLFLLHKHTGRKRQIFLTCVTCNLLSAAKTLLWLFYCCIN